MKAIKIKSPGLYTTVQDGGRYGYQSYGIPSSGAMDMYAYEFNNRLLENDKNTAVLEITITGPKIEFIGDMNIAITGADITPDINGCAIDNWRVIGVKSGDVLSFGKLKSGCRAYIGFDSGIDVKSEMGSRSTYVRGELGGYKGRTLKFGDTIEIIDSKENSDYLQKRFVPKKYIPDYSGSVELRVILGPQSYMFTEEEKDKLFESEYICSKNNDRMGYRLIGNKLESEGGTDIISDAVALGAIQVTSEGHPIVMMADRQTVGGYAKIACVVTKDIFKLAQCKTGDSVRFKKIEVEEL